MTATKLPAGCVTAALSPYKQLSHTATPLDSGSWKLLLFQVLESMSQSPGPVECCLDAVPAAGTTGRPRRAAAPKTFMMVPAFLNHEFEQKPCWTLNVTARQKESH